MFTEDYLPTTLSEVTRKNAELRGDAVATVFEGRETTFGVFNRHCNQVANGLATLGVQPQKHIAYLGKNSDLYFELLYGAAKARAILAPVNWRLAPPEIAYIVNDCAAEVLSVGPEFADGLRAFAQRDRTAVKALKSEFWAERFRALGGRETFRIGQALREHARRVRPDWPTEKDRREDLADHIEWKRQIDRAANAFTGR